MPALPAQRSIRLPLVVGGATVLGVFSGLQAFNYVTLFSEKPQSLAMLITLNLGYWYAWAVLTPPILWMARRFRLDRRTWARAVPAHMVAVLVIVLAHVLLQATLRQAAWQLFGFPPRGGVWQTWLVDVQRLYFLNFDWEMMTYWAVVGLSHALDYRRESQERAVAAAQLETRLAEAQLQALESQLHPHFLFNTLHTISALMHRDVDAADTMIARLSDLLRLTLDRIGVQEVSLKEELEFLGTYLEIEQTRFQDRLTVQFDIQPETLDARVPNLLLQPLVENAIRHGIAARTAGGRLVIRAAHEGHALAVEVRDNGPGLPPATRTDVGPSGGVGLANTRARLAHLYGDACRFDFHEPEGGGLSVLITIPFGGDGERARRDPVMEVVA